MAPPRSVHAPPNPNAGDRGPFPEGAGLQASSKLDLTVPTLDNSGGEVEKAYADDLKKTYGDDNALGIDIKTFQAGRDGGNVRNRLTFDKDYHASPQHCSEEVTPTAKKIGQFQQGEGRPLVLTRTWNAPLRLSNHQRNKLLKLIGGRGGYRCLYNLTIELLCDAGHGSGEKGSVAPSIDPAMWQVIRDCVSKEGTNRGCKRLAGADEEKKNEATADYEAALEKLNNGRIDAGKAAIDTPVGWFLVHNPKLKGMPQPLRQHAFNEACQAYKTNVAKQQKAQRDHKTPQKFKLKFKRASKLSSWTIPIDGRSITNVEGFAPDKPEGQQKKEQPPAKRNNNYTRFNLFPSYFGKGNKTFVISGKMPKGYYDGETRECRIVVDRLGPQPRFRLFMTYQLRATDLPEPKPAAQRQVAAVDPGQRTLGTVYTPRGCVCDACPSGDPNKGTGKLIALLKHESAAKARCVKLKFFIKRAERQPGRSIAAAMAELEKLSKRLRKAQQAVERRKARVRGWVTQMHRSYAHWLLREFDTVIYPYFGTQGMVRKGSKLHPAVKKILMRQRHYGLRRYIEDRARTLGKEVVFVTEYYTTMTCGVCGHRNKNVGGAKVFKCVNKDCGICMPRDGNGARNIMLQLYVV